MKTSSYRKETRYAGHSKRGTKRWARSERTTSERRRVHGTPRARQRQHSFSATGSRGPHESINMHDSTTKNERAGGHKKTGKLRRLLYSYGRLDALAHLGATKAWAPAAQATAMTADFIFELGWV